MKTTKFQRENDNYYNFLVARITVIILFACIALLTMSAVGYFDILQQKLDAYIPGITRTEAIVYFFSFPTVLAVAVFIVWMIVSKLRK